MADRATLDTTIGLLFNDTSKNISDLKSREWNATTLGVAGIAGLASVCHTSGRACGTLTHVLIIIFMGSVAIGHLVVMLRCRSNLRTFRGRLKRILEERLEIQAHALFDGDLAKLIVDEGTIEWVAFFAVWLAFLFGLLDALAIV